MFNGICETCQPYSSLTIFCMCTCDAVWELTRRLYRSSVLFFVPQRPWAVLPIKFYWGWVMDFHQGVFQMNNLISSLPVFMECPWTPSMDMYSRLCHRLVSPSHETHVILYYLRYCHYSQLLPRLESRQRLLFSFLATMTWLIPQKLY